MSDAAPASRTSVWVCGWILGLTAAAKAFALMHGEGLLGQPHPFLPGPYEVYVWLSLAAELVVLWLLALVGRRAFLTVCLGLSVVFIGYHALEAGLDVPTPCPCLGGVLGHWKPLAGAESALSFLLASALAVSSFVGLFPVSPQTPTAPRIQSPRLPAAVAMGLWLLAGGAVVWLWHGHILAGDEGMEAAKSLQLLVRPASLTRMWNDQPPLWSQIGAGLFQVFGPSMTVGRVAVVLIGLILPLTWAIYWSRAGIPWAAVVSVSLLWLTVPYYSAAFMLEAPAYAVGLAALIPLVLYGDRPLPWLVSVLLAALALSLKLTAAFALVVPFSWLFQRNVRHAVGWGFAVVALTVLGSLIEPGWTWRLMAASHLNFRAEAIWRYHLNPAAYAHAWFACLLAVFAVANRYVQNRLSSVVPWISAAVTALLIHLLHHPFWTYYNLHLLMPVVALAGVGAVNLCKLLQRGNLSRLECRCLAGVVIALGLFWAWQQAQQIAITCRTATLVATSPITEQLHSLGKEGHTAFSMNPAWTFAARQIQTPPELTIVPLKRVWSGQINDALISGLLASNYVDALVLNQSVLKQSVWSNLLAAYLPTARQDENILFVRRALNPKPIDLGEASETTVDLRRLGLESGSNIPPTRLSGILDLPQGR
jgi:hypothetical protein